MKKLIAIIMVSLVSPLASAGIKTILDCRSPAGVDSVVKRVVVEKLNNGNLDVSVQSAWDSQPKPQVVVRSLGFDDSYKKLVLEDKQGSTASLIMLQRGNVERAAIVYEGPNAPQGKEFGAAIDFLDCN